eukprot:30977-Pelagococcus_subviridis.AAC.7
MTQRDVLQHDLHRARGLREDVADDGRPGVVERVVTRDHQQRASRGQPQRLRRTEQARHGVFGQPRHLARVDLRVHEE